MLVSALRMKSSDCSIMMLRLLIFVGVVKLSGEPVLKEGAGKLLNYIRVIPGCYVLLSNKIIFYRNQFQLLCLSFNTPYCPHLVAVVGGKLFREIER